MRAAAFSSAILRSSSPSPPNEPKDREAPLSSLPSPVRGGRNSDEEDDENEEAEAGAAAGMKEEPATPPMLLGLREPMPPPPPLAAPDEVEESGGAAKPLPLPLPPACCDSHFCDPFRADLMREGAAAEREPDGTAAPAAETDPVAVGTTFATCEPPTFTEAVLEELSDHPGPSASEL